MIVWIVQLIGLVIAIIGVFASWPLMESRAVVRWGIFGAFLALAVIAFLGLILGWTALPEG